MRYLIDTSALVRVIRRQVDPRWDEQTGHGVVAVCLSVTDHLAVATARHHGLTVLHDDADFETVGRIVPDFGQERISR